MEWIPEKYLDGRIFVRQQSTSPQTPCFVHYALVLHRLHFGMRRWRRWFIPVVGTVTFALAVRYVYRTAHDNAQLRKYSQQLKPGLTRKEIKSYLQAHGTKFGERCCDQGFHAFAVIVKVDENVPPPFCSAWPVYVAFEFTVEPPYDLPIPVDAESLKKLQRKELEYLPGESDILTKVQLVSSGENCL